MPLPRLPDISLDTWIRDQQQQFERQISSLGEATEFSDAVSDIESQVPADYPHPGGTDQWAEAQQQQQEEEYRRQQQEDERRQAEENQRQLEAYLNEKMRYEQEQQAQAQQDALLQQTQQAGIASPDQALAEFEAVKPGEIPQPVQDFHDFASQIEQGQLPPGMEEMAARLQSPSPPRGVPSAYDVAPQVGQQAPPPLEEPAPRRGVPSAYDVAPQQEPPSAERPYWQPTARESEAMGPGVGPEWLPEGARRTAGVVTKAVTSGAEAYTQGEQAGPAWLPGGIRSGLGTASAAMEPVQAAQDYASARIDPQTWYFARDGIARTELEPGELDRWNELQGSIASSGFAGAAKATWTPEEAQEIKTTTDKIERIYQSIKNDPDKLTQYAEASPAYRAVQMTTGVVLGGALGNVAGGAASSGARALGASERVARGAGYAADIAAQTAFDPTTPALQPLGDIGLRGIGAGVRGGRSLLGRAGRALEASADEIPTGTERLGSGFQTAMDMEADPAFAGMRPRVIPTDVARQLDYFPLNVPTDPEVIKAVRRAGGTVDEHGVTVNTIRMQGPEAAGGIAARGGTFHTAGPPGAESMYAKSTSSATDVGGNQRIEGETTFRNPLVLQAAPGDGSGFDEAMRTLNVTGPASPSEITRLEQRLAQTERIASYPDATLNHKSQVDTLRRQLEDARAGRGRPIRSTQISDEIREARQAGPEASPERAQALKDLLTRYGGDPDLVDELIAIRGVDADESAWAIRENIVTAQARKNRHDGVLAMPESGSGYQSALEEAVEAHPHWQAQNTIYRAAVTDMAAAERAAELARDTFGVHTPEHQAAYARLEDATERVRRENRKLDNIHDRLIDEVEVTVPREISELVDPRVGRNPTPGYAPPEIARLEQTIEALKGDEERAWAAMRKAAEKGMSQAEMQGYADDIKRIQYEATDATAALQELRQQVVPGRPGYELRPDIPAPEGVRRSTIVENPRIAEIEREYEEARTAYERLRHLDPATSTAEERFARSRDPEVKAAYERMVDARTLRNEVQAGYEPRWMTALGSGVSPRLRAPLFNAAQGGFFGAASENLEAQQEGREVDPATQLQRTLIGGGLGLLAGSRGARRLAGRTLQRLGSGVVPEGGRAVDSTAMIQGIRQIRAAGAADDAVLNAERHVAENTNMTLDEVQQLTRADEAVNPWEPTAAERAEIARQDAEIAGRPAHGGYLPEDELDEAEIVSRETTLLESPPRAGEEVASEVAAAENILPENLPPSRSLAVAPPSSLTAPGGAAGRAAGGGQAPPGMYTTVGGGPPGPLVTTGGAGGGPPGAGVPPPGAGGGGGRNLPPVGQMYTGSQRPSNRPVSSLESLRRWFVRENTDRKVDLNELQKEVAKEIGRPLNADELVSELARRNTNQAAHVHLLEGLRPALLRAGKDQPLLSEALTYLDNIAVSQALNAPNRTFSLGLTAAESQQRLNDLLQLMGGAGSDRVIRLGEGIRDVRAFTDSYRKRMLDSGVWSQDLYDDLTTRYPTYIPTRIVDYIKNDHAVPSGRKLGLQDSGLRSHTLAGTAAEREDPLASITRLAYESESRIRRNETFNAFVKLREASPKLQQAIRPVPTTYVGKQGETVVHGFVDGTKHTYAMSEPIAQAVMMESGSSLPGWATAIPNLFRALITHSPVFVAGQVPLDAFSYMVREAGRQGGPQHVPRVAAELVKSYAEAFRGITSGEFRGDAAELLKAGGGMAGWQGRSLEATAGKLSELGHGNMFELRDKNDVGRLMKWVATMQPVAAVGNRFELAPRIASYRLANRRTTPQMTTVHLNRPGGGTFPIQQLGGRPLSEVEQVMAARDITLDFERGGGFARVLNQVIPFYNVGWQSSAAIARAARENPVGFSTSALSLVGGLTVGAEAWNRSDPQREKDYEDVPDGIKNRGVVIMWPGQAPVDKNGDRRPNYLIVPMRELAPIAIMAREAALKVVGKDTKTWGEIAGETAKAASPIQATNAEDLFSSFMPTGVSTALGVASDRDFFRGQQINTKFRNEEASAASKAISTAARSRGLEWSPAQVEFVLRDLGGGAARAGLAASDMATGKIRDDSRLQNTPVVGDLIRRFVGDATGGVMARERDQTIRPETRAKLRAAGVEYTPDTADFDIGQMPLRRTEVGELQQKTNQYVEENLNRLMADPIWTTLTPSERRTGAAYQVSLARQRAKAEILDRISADEANRRAIEAAGQKAGVR